MTTPQSHPFSGISRRQILKGGAALAVTPAMASFLTACGSDNGGSSAKKTSELNAILWSGIFDSGIPDFEKKTGIKVNVTNQVDPIQTANMIKVSPGDHDVVVFGPFSSPVSYEVQHPDLERAKVAWEAQYPYFREMWDPAVLAPESFGGKPRGIVHLWNSTVLAWNTEKVKTPPTSWDIMADPKYKGRTAFNDQAAEMYGTFALAMGGDPNSFTEADLDSTNEIAAQWFSNAKSLWSTGDDVKQLMAQGEVWVGHIFDGTARQLMKDGYPIDYTYPDQGVRGSVDALGILKGTSNLDGAYEFINFMMGEEFSAQMAKNTLYAPGNASVAESLDPETKALMRLDEMSDMLASGKFFLQTPEANDFATLDKWWTALKLKNQT